MSGGGATEIRRVVVLGDGGMGTAMALLLSRNGRETRLWGRDAAYVQQMRRTRENERFLPEIEIPTEIELSGDVEQVSRGVDLIVAAIPSAFLRKTLKELAPGLPAGVPVLSVVKGIERETFARPTQIVREVLGERGVAALSGPSHAEEVARGLPASVVVAGEDEGLNDAIRDALNCVTFRVYTNDDPVGVELAGAMKNVMGIAAGICDGLGFGDNAKAALLTRGLAEMARFGRAHGARSSTYLGLSGVGDLITTCYSPFGRNRSLGLRIGRGESLEEVQRTSQGVAEGVYTAESALAEARVKGIDLPITEQVHEILFGGKPPKRAVSDLMERLPKGEWE